MRTSEVVLDQPFGEPLIEYNQIIGHIARPDELILERAVEPLIHCIVLGCLDPRPVVFEGQRLAGGFEVAVELATIVSLNVLNLAVKQEVKPVQEITRRCRSVAGIHPGKSHLGMAINRGEDVPLLAVPVFDDRVQADQEAGDRLSLQFGDFLPRMGKAASAIDPALFSRLWVES